MRCLLVFLIVLAMLMLVTGSLTQLRSAKRRRRRTYERLAKHFQGKYLAGGLFSRPSVRIPYGNTRATLREAASRQPYEGMCTQLEIEWPNQRMLCEVLPRSCAAGPHVRGLHELKTGNPRFDHQYRTNGMNQKEVAELLSDGVRLQIERIGSLPGEPSLYLLLYRGTILIQKPERLDRYEELEQFIQQSLQLYDQLMLTRAEGIEFLDNDQAHMLGEVICKICGDPITSDLVYCRRCKTPHHGDCWTYTGACSVFGCQETVCRRPQTAEPARDSHTGH